MALIGSVERVGQVLDLFTTQQPEWGVTQVAEQLGVSKSSAHALLNTLCGVGLLRRTPEGRYQLGWRLVALSRVLMETAPVRQAALDVMERLVRIYGETVHLASLQNGKVVYLEKLQGNRAVRVEITGVGAELWAHASSLGKVLLSDLSQRELLQVLQRRGMPAFTVNTITDAEEFLQEIDQVRTQGYAYDIEEYALDLCCVGAPIRNHAGVVAAISFSVPAYRFYEAKIAYRNAIVEAAHEISERLGYTEEAWKRSK